MDPLTIKIRRALSTEAVAVDLIARHLELMHASSPPDSVHALDASGLTGVDVAFFVLEVDGVAAAMGALKMLGDNEGELKSMHVAAEWRGRGLGKRILEHLLEHARAQGLSRLNLETGTQPAFASARGMYAAAGFTLCPPFADYSEDPNSTFMALDL